MRVRELEKGLEEEHSLHSSEPHRLLQESLLSIAAPPTQEDHEAEAEDGPISGFGTLMMANDGTRMKWLGATAVASWFLEGEGEEADNPSQDGEEGELENGILDLCHNFPFGDLQVDDRLRDEIYAYLPQDESEAIILVECYFKNVAWLYNFVPKKNLLEMVHTLYDPSAPPLHPHRVAILYAVFALNVLVDQFPRPSWRKSSTYRQLACAALGAETIFGANATLATVQAMCLLSLWYQLAFESGDPSKSWGFLGLTFKIAQSIGLHRDGRGWNLPEEEALDRRRTFWELQALDSWQAMNWGRPPSITKMHLDCPQPFDTEESLGHPPHFHRWKHHYVSEGIMNILDQVLIPHTTTSPPHAIILKLDTKIRSCAIPAKLQLKDASARAQADDMLLLQHYTSMLSRESALMYLHRGFFAKAVFDPPHDPLRHKFAHSVLAAYTSATQILKWLNEIITSYSHILNRIFGWWGHAYSSAVTLGGLVVMAPACNLAEQALKEFDIAIDMLNKGTVGVSARRILPALEKLQTKAHRSIQLHRSGMWKPEKKAPPPPEMPGLGTATLPLAGKSEQTPPRTSPPIKTSPSSGPRLPANIDLPAFHSPSELHLRPVTILPDAHMQEQNMDFIPMAISPQEIMNAATANYYHPSTQFQDQTVRPCSRAQSFDDFLRLHRLQDREMPGPISSAPPVRVELPQQQQQHQMMNYEQISEHRHQESWEQHPYAPSFDSYGEPHNIHENRGQPVPHRKLDGMSHFPVTDQGEYAVDAYNYSELTWQHFMNGLEL